MNWDTIFVQLFGAKDFLGIDAGVWVALVALMFIAAIVNALVLSKEPMERTRTREILAEPWKLALPRKKIYN
jgi:hypothetical protein